MLMPSQSIARELRQKLTLPKLGQLKLKWHVAMSALMYRATSLGILSPEAATSLSKKMSMYGCRLVAPPPGV